MTRRLDRALVAVTLAATWGCRELSTPEGGVQSVSRVILPSPGLVVGDTMRDSLGNVARLTVVAFDEHADTISPAPAAVFVLLDTTATLEGDTLVGRFTGNARVFATVAGLQTNLSSVVVTLRPDTLAAADSTHHVRRVNLLTNDSSYASADLNVIARNVDGAAVTGVDAVIVTYTLTRVPPGTGSGRAVVFVGDTALTTRDTTSNGGRAARAVRLRIPAQMTLPDSAIVQATASYRGQTLGTIQFTIVFQEQ